MGLAVEVTSVAIANKLDEEAGEWLEREIGIINQLLTANGLPEYQEPAMSNRPSHRGQISSFPYSRIHHLRRVMAYKQRSKPLTPVAEGRRATEDDVLRAEYDRFDAQIPDSHLISHSDTEGYYVPVDFPEPLYPINDIEVKGSVLGSSYGLRRELIAIAPLIEIELDDEQLSDKMIETLKQEQNVTYARPHAIITLDEMLKQEQDTMEHPYAIERQVWFTLFEATTASIEHGLLIQFQ